MYRVFSICGTLHSVDQYLNIKLSDISVIDQEKYPHMVSACFVHSQILAITFFSIPKLLNVELVKIML